MMEGKRVLRSLTLRNVLSFGPEAMTLDFEPLNVLIGPNGSGKSNLIEIFGLLRSLPSDLLEPFREGGIREWVWKEALSQPQIDLETFWNIGEREFRHRIEIGINESPPQVQFEAIEGEYYDPTLKIILEKKYELKDFNYYFFSSNNREHNVFDRRDLYGRKSTQSILAQIKDDEPYPELGHIRDRLSDIRLYRDWTFGRDSHIRLPQSSGQPDELLAENARNLSLVLRRIKKDPVAASSLINNLQKAYEGIEDIRIEEKADNVFLSLIEEGSRVISARRLSDGTLRYLGLLALLCDPSPSPLICLEEPELGLHPDIIPTIAKLLIEASQRTQLIVTTHSADLVSALGEVPEAVVICEKRWGSTTLRRLEAEPMKKWLEDYTLGHLWAMGELGGNRW